MSGDYSGRVATESAGAIMAEPATATVSILAIASITEDPIDETRLRAAVAHTPAGAVVCFAGVVRDHDAGSSVTALRYEAHPTAQTTLARTAATLAIPPVTGVAIVHRIGLLQIGETALACAVSAPHRAAAFETCTDLVDAVKATVPIWKLQYFADGSSTWS